MRYINDDQIILSLDGLRWLAKRDEFRSQTSEKWQLEYGYKGHNGSLWYDSKEKRDEMYDKTIAAIKIVNTDNTGGEVGGK